MKDKIFLVGNGVNNIRQDYRWIDLINNLINFIGATGQINMDDKPFPLLYEEIFVEAVKNRGFREGDIKDFIAREVSKLEPNEIHQRILEMNCEHLLTTNYDFTFEKLFLQDTSSLKNTGEIKENVYSLFRHHTINKCNFWHIHGDANVSNSITLGYEHYSGYLQQMRNYVATGTGTAYKIRLDSLLRRLKNRSQPVYSWVDFFFTKDIYIIGLTLDFIEIHLWWLLTFRQRVKLLKQLPVNNQIVYFYPDIFSKKIQNKLDLFRSVDVMPFSVPYNDANKLKFYLEILKKIKNNLR